ncbi:hypothetical protein LTR70_004868 [Exophiala xenobiotica]|uniref:Uncharacterized protein n=1 Tax=Lithohypha guttulata TaxID=1690604 RepID=A0ABR0KDE4_9EURO|nr:hypothetical protein LTR24_004486 [Lithohypha guttulata]KAK5319823.1 hypothetical protein LTR70_004868 [Exophiala xenobiotica]
MELLFSSIPKPLTSPRSVFIYSDDWTLHEHRYSSSAEFLFAAAELVRLTVFHNDLDGEIQRLLPSTPDLDGLDMYAPRLRRLFQQACLRVHFEAIDITATIVPKFTEQYESLIGRPYNGQSLRSTLMQAVQVAARLRVALALYPDIRYQYEGLSGDMVVDIHTLERPIGRLWKVILPAITTVDSLGVVLVLCKAMAFNDVADCVHCSRARTR